MQMREGPASNPASAAGVVIPFVQGSKPEVEEGPAWYEVQLGAQSINLGPIALPANGYIRHLIINVETVEEGAGAALEASEDFPFNILELVKLSEPNNAPLGVELSGFQCAMANIFGVYAGVSDMRTASTYSAEAKKPKFQMRIPVEISPNGLGSLGNQSASAALRLFLRINPATVVYKKAGEKYPKINITTEIELWGEPPATDLLGRPVQPEPPFEGTSQMWTVQNKEKVTSGKNNIKMTQLGAMIRNVLFICRTSAGVRTDKVFPGPYQIQLDNRTFRTQSQTGLIFTIEGEVIGLKERPSGVFLLSFAKGEQHSQGANEINSWLSTMNSTRLELLGNSAEAGEMDILTNYISVTTANPEERTLQVGKSGYHPPVGMTSEAAA